MFKYRFKAVYEDNTIYLQTPDDVSVKDKTRSSFYDVDRDKLVYFALCDDLGNETGVNVRTGEFTVNKQVFRLASPKVTNYRLIYFRRVFKTLPTNSTKIEFHLGWQANDEQGNNVERTVVL